MKKAPPKTLGIALWIFAALVVIAVIYWVLQPKPIAVEIHTVQRGLYTQYVTEEGRTRAREIYKITSPVKGDLLRVQHHPGDWVKEGDFLAEVEWPQAWKINSPVSGRILRVQRESAGPIERGDLIMEVANPGALEVVSEVLTDDAVQIKEGAPVRIESWGGCPDLEGNVRVVEPAAFTKVSALGIEEQRVNIIIDITSPKDLCKGLADGFRVNNHIATYRQEGALIVPTGALFREGEGWAVFQVKDGKVHKRLVKIKKRNPETALLESGLKQGDKVVVYPSDQVVDGTRVKPLKSSTNPT